MTPIPCFLFVAALLPSSPEGAVPEVGQPAPAFTLPDDGGHEVSLQSLRGEKVLLAFYPKDFTGG